MRDLTYLVAISLDGFIAQIDGSHEGFSTDAAYWQALFQEGSALMHGTEENQATPPP